MHFAWISRSNPQLQQAQHGTCGHHSFEGCPGERGASGLNPGERRPALPGQGHGPGARVLGPLLRGLVLTLARVEGLFDQLEDVLLAQGLVVVRPLVAA
jgi:hypothetical protein